MESSIVASMVCCESCSKWRDLPRTVKPSDLPESFFCTMCTWLPGNPTCETPEKDPIYGHDPLHMLGERVVALYRDGSSKRRAYSATIVGVNKASWMIDWDDGEQSQQLHRWEDIWPPKAAAPKAVAPKEEQDGGASADEWDNDDALDGATHEQIDASHVEEDTLARETEELAQWERLQAFLALSEPLSDSGSDGDNSSEDDNVDDDAHSDSSTRWKKSNSGSRISAPAYQHSPPDETPASVAPASDLELFGNRTAVKPSKKRRTTASLLEQPFVDLNELPCANESRRT
jgi:hypothetical protein